MNRIVIKNLQETNYSYDIIATLIHDSFTIWEEQGLNSVLLHLTADEFIDRTKNGQVFVAYDTELDKLIGTITFFVHSKGDVRWGMISYLAVHNSARNRGIGSALIRHSINTAALFRCSYVLSDTAYKAIWSVRLHEKMGFNKFGFDSFSTNNYYSVIFRYQLDKNSIFKNSFFCRCVYIVSFLKTIIVKRHDGKSTKVGLLIKNIRYSFLKLSLILCIWM